MIKEEYWQNYSSYELCTEFNNDFDIWWDPEKFYWHKNDSWALCKYIPYKFDIWWDPDKFNWIRNSGSLYHYLLNKIISWYQKHIIIQDKSYNINTNIINIYVNNLEWDYD